METTARKGRSSRRARNPSALNGLNKAAQLALSSLYRERGRPRKDPESSCERAAAAGVLTQQSISMRQHPALPTLPIPQTSPLPLSTPDIGILYLQYYLI